MRRYTPTRTIQSRWPVISVMIRPRTAGPNRIVVTRVWTLPVGVGHMSGLPLRELLGLADSADRLDRPARQADLHRKSCREAAHLQPLGTRAVADEAARDVFEPRAR